MRYVVCCMQCCIIELVKGSIKGTIVTTKTSFDEKPKRERHLLLSRFSVKTIKTAYQTEFSERICINQTFLNIIAGSFGIDAMMYLIGSLFNSTWVLHGNIVIKVIHLGNIISLWMALRRQKKAEHVLRVMDFLWSRKQPGWHKKIQAYTKFWALARLEHFTFVNSNKQRSKAKVMKLSAILESKNVLHIINLMQDNYPSVRRKQQAAIT